VRGRAKRDLRKKTKIKRGGKASWGPHIYWGGGKALCHLQKKGERGRKRCASLKEGKSYPRKGESELPRRGPKKGKKKGGGENPREKFNSGGREAPTLTQGRRFSRIEWGNTKFKIRKGGGGAGKVKKENGKALVAETRGTLEKKGRGGKKAYVRGKKKKRNLLRRKDHLPK